MTDHELRVIALDRAITHAANCPAYDEPQPSVLDTAADFYEFLAASEKDAPNG